MVMPRKTKMTDLGLEIECCKCGEFYPADTEFFYAQKNTKYGIHSWCKACYEQQPSVIAKRQRWQEKQKMQRRSKNANQTQNQNSQK